MRATTALITLLTLVALGPAPPATAGPDEVAWLDVTELPGDGQLLAADPATGDVLAMTSPFQEEQVVRRLDGRTGAVEWVTAVSGDMSRMTIDPTDGRIVLAGAHNGPQRLVVLDSAGAIVRDVLTDLAVRSVTELAVHPTSGTACTLGASGRRDTEKVWVTSCWDRGGSLVFSQGWEPPDGKSQPNALAIDPVRHRVLVAGTSRPYGEHTGPRQDVVVIAYAANGNRLWVRQRAGAVSPGFFTMALDTARGRIHLLGRPATIQSPVRLFSFDSAGRREFVRSWRDRTSTYDAALAVTSNGRVLAVSADGTHASLRSYSPVGRLLGARVVRTARRGDDGGLPKIVVDGARRRAHVLNGSDDNHGARVFSFSFTGSRIGNALVDPADFTLTSSIVLHAATGRVYAATNPWPDGHDRIAALEP